MKKQTLRAVTMLVSIIAVAFATAIVSSAQPSANRLRANVPFEFVVGDKTLAAGEYSISQMTTGTDAIVVRSNDGGHSAIRLTNAVSSREKQKKTTLTFLRYGNTYFLSQVWVSGSSEGREMLKSKAERAAERELARNASSNSLAQQNAKPEIVTIVADVE